MKNLWFVTSAYGDDYLGLLLTNIYSLVTSNPFAQTVVTYNHIRPDKLTLLKKAFPKVDFIEYSCTIANDPIKRISTKTIFWEFSATKYLDKNLCFIDADTLVLKDISHFFENDFDVIFTYKDETFPLNTGVMLVKNSEKTLAFFTLWRKKTFEILKDNNLFEIANSQKYPYGGADQMALYNILDYKKGIYQYEISISNKRLIFKGIPCSILNETKSRSISKNHHIIHYKSGWRPILLEGSNFTKNRTKKQSMQMYLLYIRTYMNAIDFLKQYETNISYSDFIIKIPFYLNCHTFEVSSSKYLLFVLINEVKLLLKKVRKLTRKLIYY